VKALTAELDRALKSSPSQPLARAKARVIE
jgi:hypothetical protein